MVSTMRCIYGLCTILLIVEIAGCLLLSSDVDLSHGETSVVSGGSQAKIVFKLSDHNNDSILTYPEATQVFTDFDADGNGNVTTSEFFTIWNSKNLGPQKEGLQLFLHLDVNHDFVIEKGHDMPFIFRFFDRNGDRRISEDEFVIQWLKISQ
ncbi:hypothetical protein ACF0H5_018014 [Mactra antiquata]